MYWGNVKCQKCRQRWVKGSKVPKSRSEKDKTRFGGAVKRVRYCFAAIFRAIWKGFSHNVTATDDEDMLVLYSLAQITQLWQGLSRFRSVDKTYHFWSLLSSKPLCLAHSVWPVLFGPLCLTPLLWVACEGPFLPLLCNLTAILLLLLVSNSCLFTILVSVRTPVTWTFHIS